MIRPLHDFILIKPDEAKEKSDGGIFIPTVAQEKTFPGTVLSVGDGYWDAGHYVEPVVCPGDRVLYAKYDGNEIECEGEKFLLIKEAAIYAVLESESTGDGSSKPWVGEEAKQLSKKEQAAVLKEMERNLQTKILGVRKLRPGEKLKAVALKKHAHK
jgi:chaperonin GroES